ncbi:MAG: PQQ-binding-like beta-propeller repeat protein [Planctomycetota bacterium]
MAGSRGGILTGDAGNSGPLVLFSTTADTGVVALDAGNGRAVFTYALAAGAGPVTLLDDGTILVRGPLGLVALSAAGERLWFLNVAANFGAAAVADDGTLYVAGGPPGSFGAAPAQTDTLYAVQGPARLANAPWPAPRHDSANTGFAGGP